MKAGSGMILLPSLLAACTPAEAEKETQQEDASKSAAVPFFEISLAQWSLHKNLQAGKINAIDFPQVTRQKFDIGAVEYVNRFFIDYVEDFTWLGDLKQRCADFEVENVLIMCDGLGHLGDMDDAKRLEAVNNHKPWVNAAKFLGCHSIRVNAAGEGTAEEVQQAAIQGLGSLSEYAATEGINVIVENHGGYSSNGEWLAGVMKQVNMDNCGTLPDFGNFCITRGEDGCEEEYDRYKGMEELLPYAKGVSAKSYRFDDAGNEIDIDFERILKLVQQSGYTGYIGIEYEGSELDEYAGIKATKDLLERLRG